MKVVVTLQIIHSLHLVFSSGTEINLHIFCLFPRSMPRHHQPFEPSGLQRGPLPEHGEDLQQLHCGLGELGDHLHGGAP